MNWSHALLDVSIASTILFILGYIATCMKPRSEVELEYAANGLRFLLIVAIVTGALAAGLWS